MTGHSIGISSERVFKSRVVSWLAAAVISAAFQLGRYGWSVQAVDESLFVYWPVGMTLFAIVLVLGPRFGSWTVTAVAALVVGGFAGVFYADPDVAWYLPAGVMIIAVIAVASVSRFVSIQVLAATRWLERFATARTKTGPDAG